jgi:hypothetical protein
MTFDELISLNTIDELSVYCYENGSSLCNRYDDVDTKLSKVIRMMSLCASVGTLTKVCNLVSTILKKHPEYYSADIGCGSNVYYWVQQQCNKYISVPEQDALIDQIVAHYIVDKSLVQALTTTRWFNSQNVGFLQGTNYNNLKQKFEK